ncbi:rhodanese-like domain-containing protein [Winogradskyella sp. DF17]|uniref:Rhodanese-like domain-containing protein n=1 Tax=Winogradskyella pelagia TaxID=2819984 RepID=A0ABS3T2R4_9FLAO|nr:rhodanese-like domain-containing protein [Winogradskyella sp. DF17]MBO3117044.1 rhodanese-like domain-containing protein [Winogradskyella sp. DF17]
MGFLDFLTGNSTNQLREYLQKKAVILDVRTHSEYQSNNIESAIHIPLNELEYRVEEIKVLNKPVIVHCASGMRSAKAASFLKSNGVDTINGGGIAKLKSVL